MAPKKKSKRGHNRGSNGKFVKVTQTATEVKEQEDKPHWAEPVLLREEMANSPAQAAYKKHVEEEEKSNDSAPDADESFEHERDNIAIGYYRKSLENEAAAKARMEDATKVLGKLGVVGYVIILASVFSLAAAVLNLISVLGN